jgi:hypothetical protein
MGKLPVGADPETGPGPDLAAGIEDPTDAAGAHTSAPSGSHCISMQLSCHRATTSMSQNRLQRSGPKLAARLPSMEMIRPECPIKCRAGVMQLTGMKDKVEDC